MKYFCHIVLLLLVISIGCQAQSIKKVAGVKTISIGYSKLRYGNGADIRYSNFFSKGYYYFIQGSWENSTVYLTSYSSYTGGLGLGKCVILPIRNLYLNIDLGANIGSLKITNEYFTDKNEWVYNAFLMPGVEYFFTDKLAISLGSTFFKDFNTGFRNYHYSYNAILSIIF